MPRPRSVTDEDVLAAAARVIAREGPHEFTLRQVGDEAGLSASTVLQRFKTKRGLLLAMAARGAAHVDAWFDGARRRHESRLDALLDAVAEGARGGGRHVEVANHLAFLQMDLSDPEFHKHTRDFFRAFRTRVQTLLDEAVQRGELRRKTDTAMLARGVEAAYHGALLAWAIHREGKADETVAATVDALLAGSRPNLAVG